MQKSAFKIILQNKYTNYEEACKVLNVQKLKTRRENLLKKFTRKNINHEKMQEYFTLNKNAYQEKLRFKNKYEVTNTRTERFKRSTIVQMQKIANEEQE